MIASWKILFTAFLLVPLVKGSTDFEKHCLAFRPERFIHNSTLTRLEYLPNSTTIDLGENTASCNRQSQVTQADICRIALHIPTSKRSSITFELWLPSKWEGRYLATGNGGLDGCIKYEELAYGTSHGFATMGTNNGHNGTTGQEFFHNPDILEDFAYRALHVGTQSAKTLLEKFYQKKPAHSYYIGCSLGGRMGIKAAEKFPNDYDGIVAGAPTVDFNHLQGQRAMFYPITGPAWSPDFITEEVWKSLIHPEVLAQCDGLDGVKDGILEVPGRCVFDPSTLLCQTGEKKDCLTAVQVDKLQRIYAPYEAADGTLIFPRVTPGNELQAAPRLYGGEPWSYSQDWFRYVVLEDPDWDPINYTRELARQADELNPFNIRTYPQKLPAFRERGGKIISYHGGQDQQVTSFNTERFWDQMAAADPKLADYYRFFRISGMNHCSGGPGAWAVGQGGGASAAGIPFEPHRNVLAAIVAWVEKGKKPESLRGTKFVDDSYLKGVDYQRDHCPYPKSQTYVGGDYKLPGSWRCM